jgi:hypothetical protein
MSQKKYSLSIEEILLEIKDQISNMEYLKEHPQIAQSTILHETPEYLRGAINLLTYMEQFIENHSELVSEKEVEVLAIDIWKTNVLDLDESRWLAFRLVKKGYKKG